MGSAMAKQGWTAADLLAMSGRTVVVTGGAVRLVRDRSDDDDLLRFGT